MVKNYLCKLALFAALPLLLSAPSPSVGQEVILQYFNTSWKEMEDRLPEIAEAGYTSLWLPSPCKGASGTYSVGYDVFDRFDLGDRDQMGTVRTRYGTKAELLSLIRLGHRLGLRIYFDNIMAHNGGPLDDVPAGTLFPSIPGFVPQDFHLVRKTGGGWRKAVDSVDWNDEWQVLNRNPFAWDIAQEEPNTSFDATGQSEGVDHPKWRGIRHPGRTELYLDTDLPVGTNGKGQNVYTFANKEPWEDTGWGASNTGAGNRKFDWQDSNGNGQHDTGEVSEPFTDTGMDPGTPARRVAAWGHGNAKYDMGNPVAEDVNTMLFRAQRWWVDQLHADGFRLDAVKHVPSYFFGQQSGADKDRSSDGYMGTAQEQFNLTRGFADWDNHRDTNFSTNPRNDLLLYGEHLGAPPNPSDYLSAGMRIANDDFSNRTGGFGGIGGSLAGFDAPGAFTFGVDTGMMYCLSHDNNHMSDNVRSAAHGYMLTRQGIPIVYTDGYNISGGPDYFPKPAYTPFLGQYGNKYVTAAVKLRQDFIRGNQVARWGDQDFAAWEMRDTTDGYTTVADTTCLLVMHARGFTNGQAQRMGTAFPAGARLRNYSQYNGPFYANVGNDGMLRGDDGGIVVVPSGGYFAFSYDVPELPEVWQGQGGKPPLEILQNGQAVSSFADVRKDGKNGDPAYAHTVLIPRVTDATNLTFIARADGSAENILLKLNGGIDLQANGRDNRPGEARDSFLGYEQMTFVRRVAEKFAAQSVTRNVIGSNGAETWIATLGTAGFTRNNGGGAVTNTGTATWVYHDPADTIQNLGTQPQFSPAPAAAGGQPITLHVKVGYLADSITDAWVYYTTDGVTFPEGSAGVARGTTQVVAATAAGNGTADAGGTPVWRRATLPALPSGTVLRYKIGVSKDVAPSRFPLDSDNILKKRRMETVFRLQNVNATAFTVYPHNDLASQEVGLKEGYHMLRSRVFLNRSGGSPRPGTSIYKTNTQTFYYDASRPVGSIRFPSNDNDVVGGSYGVVVLSDVQTTAVWYQTADANGTSAWTQATETTNPTNLGTTGFVKEWRFDYKNIPNSGLGTIRVRFKEPTSSADNSLTDAAGWFTTVSREVVTGTAPNFRVRFPETDGTVVGPGYGLKVYFDKSLGYAAGGAEIPESQILSEFSLFLASTQSGLPEDEALQPRASYQFIRHETDTESALLFSLPNIYNGQPEFLHHFRAVHNRGAVTLGATRLLKALPGSVADMDSDGLPDYWENQVGLDRTNPDGDFGQAGDPDRDGITNYNEFLFNLSPKTAEPPPVLATKQLPNGQLELEFPVHPARRYQVQSSSNLSQWSNLGPSVTVAASSLQTWVGTTSLNRLFYRIVVSSQ